MGPDSPSPVGLAGCGTLGRSLGRRLLGTGASAVVFDHHPEAAQPLLEAGAVWAASPAELASRCSRIVSCLPGPAEVEAIAAGPDGLWAHAAPQTIHVETSTVGPACMRRLLPRASACGIRHIDCPVSRGALRETEGGDSRIEPAELVLWVGANADHLDLARPLLERLGDRIVYCGGVGLGQTTKIVNNLIAHVLIVLVGEALILGVRGGASLELLQNSLHQRRRTASWTSCCRLRSSEGIPGPACAWIWP